MDEKKFKFILDRAGTKNEHKVTGISPQEILDEHTEELIAENDRLEERITTLEKRLGFYTLVSQDWFLDDKTFGMVVEKWLRIVREQTEYLKPLDSLGIRVLCGDLENQPAFPGIEFEFESKDIEERNVKELDNVAGLAYWGRSKIGVEHAKPSLRVQVNTFMLTGKMDSTSSTIVHELIHHKHFNLNRDVTPLASEVQAHLSGVFTYENEKTPSSVIDVLTDHESIYGFDKHQVKKVVRSVVALYGLGVDYNTVAKLIADSHMNRVKDKFDPIESYANERLADLELDQLDEQGLDYLYRLHFANQQLMARIALFELIDEIFENETLREAKKEFVREKILISPQFDENGSHIKNDKSFLQSCISPVNEEFPYDGEKNKTGIVFGYVRQGKNLIYKIGRYAQLEGTEVRARWAKDELESSHLLSVIKGCAPKIDIAEKRRIFFDYIQIGQINAEISAFFDALLDQKEKKIVFEKFVDAVSNRFGLVLAEVRDISSYSAWTQGEHNKKKVEFYLSLVRDYEELKSVLGDEYIGNSTRDLDKVVGEIKSTLDLYSQPAYSRLN